jgi:Integrase core domain.
MRSMGLQGTLRGKVKRTTFPSREYRNPFDLVHRDFHATRPNRPWVADFTHAASWHGFVFVAFVIDAFSRMIVGWRTATSMNAELTLDPLEQAIRARDNYSNRPETFPLRNWEKRIILICIVCP